MSASRKVPTTLLFLLVMTALTGLLYPALVTAVAQLAFPARANGSIVSLGGKVVGSSLLAQKFESPRYFHARPSASDFAYVGAGPSNLGPTSADLAKAVSDRRAAFAAAYGVPQETVPEDMLYSSGSGLDPDISLESALDQAGAVATARGLGAAAKSDLEAEIRKAAADSAGLLAPARVDVVSLNALLETDRRFGAR